MRMRAAPRLLRGYDARGDVGQVGMGVRARRFIERQPVAGVQIAGALGQWLHAQAGAVEESDIYWPFGK